MKKTQLARARPRLAALLAGTLAARPVQARLIDLHAGAYAGGITGWGTTAGTPDFFDRRKAPGVGVAVASTLLIFDLSTNFTQLFDSTAAPGRCGRALIGVNFDVGVGNQLFTDGIEKGKSRNVLSSPLQHRLAVGRPSPSSRPPTWRRSRPAASSRTWGSARALS